MVIPNERTKVDVPGLGCASGRIQRQSGHFKQGLEDSGRSFPIFCLKHIPGIGIIAEAELFQTGKGKGILRNLFSAADVRVEASEQLAKQALREAIRTGSKAMDALHLAAAAQAGAVEFVTGELETKALFRSSLVKVVTLRPSEP